MLHRIAPLATVAAVAFIAGILVSGGSSELDAAKRFGAAWQAQDFAAMYAELTPEAAAEYSSEEFERAYSEAQNTATIAEIAVGEARGPLDADGSEQVALDLAITTDSFGVISGELGLPVADGGVAWGPSAVFPGLREGERLERETTGPERAPILAKDGSPLAEGPVEARTTNGAGGLVTGGVGEAPRARAKEMLRQGFPEGTQAGTSGLELAFDGQLAGTPGGKLLAAGKGETRRLASARPTQGKPLRTTLDPDLQQVTADALGEQFGGVAVLDARNGEIRALSGVAFSAPQPPGSTMKIVTTVAGLEEGITEPGKEYETVTSTDVDGRAIDNAHEESCGGNLVTSFARSCNTVFAPMGAELGGERLLEEAEEFGFNSPPTLYDKAALAATQPPSSSIPDPIGGELDAAVSAIGQGQVLATPLQLASISQTIANQGVRSPTSLVKGKDLTSEAGDVEVTSPKIASQLTEMMVEVVRSGTAQAAALPDEQVAGKTGTAELGPAAGTAANDPDAEPELEVDAWFTAFAPAKRPKLAIAVMLVQADGDGGEVAAPIAQQILEAGL